jgi:YHS domain-containing protein
MKPVSFRTLIALVFGTLLFFAASFTWAQGSTLRVVLNGFDPVAYFTDSKPVKGDPRFSYDWDEGRYYFASAQHRDMFASNPDKYAPQFGGYCTGSMSRGVKNEGHPEGWVIHEGKLYVFGAPKWKEIAEKDPQYLPSRIPNATRNWNEKRGHAS